MKQNTGKEALRKKPYIAPRVMKVDLTAEEVMLGFCKTPTNSGARTGTLCSLCATTIGS